MRLDHHHFNSQNQIDERRKQYDPALTECERLQPQNQLVNKERWCFATAFFDASNLGERFDARPTDRLLYTCRTLDIGIQCSSGLEGLASKKPERRDEVRNQ